MQYAELFNKILVLPFDEALKLFEEYNAKVGFKTFAEQQRVLDIMTHKKDIMDRLKDEVIQEAAIAYTFMSLGNDYMGDCAFERMKKYPMIVWIEALKFLRDEDILNLLSNYHKKLTPSLIGMLIANVDEKLQVKAIEEYNKTFDVEDKMFLNLYYSVSDKARSKLKEYFPDDLGSDILLEINDLNEEEAIALLIKNKDVVVGLDADSFIESILLKVTKASNFEIIIDNFKELIDECSAEKFELFLTRYSYLENYRYKSNDYYFDDDIDEKQMKEPLTDLDLFYLFKDKFHQIGVERTLLLFDNKEYYKSNEFTIEVILNLLDVAYSDCEISQYINEATTEELIRRFTDSCREKDYSLSDFEQLVKKIDYNGHGKLIYDDYIEAIVACGKLLKEKVIDDRNPLFIELRDKFSDDLISRALKDGTFTDNISFNGVFYRLAKGTMPFEKVYMTKNYKGLIYLTKCGQLIDNADYVTNFLTDEQLAKMNISPVIKWKNMIDRKNTGADNLSFVERMGLQLLCYFGKDKGKYLLESDMQGNLMENLFDGLNYSSISIRDDGSPEINEELINFLFGYGKINETNTVINKMIRGELPEFKKYFTEFCNEYFNIKEACNGVLSVRRIVKHFEDVDLPIELKPDELEFKGALIEMNTISDDKLRKAVQLCKDARDRDYSTIPKVSGKTGSFRYEILDLDNPLAVAVGNLSHCCFIVGGISYSALKHSMQSKNGRTFVVYYDDKFLTQSWVWRNGDVICFDSVEAGSPVHGAYSDDIKLLDIYKEAARKMLSVSRENEDDIQRVKVITVGKSDYTFNGLTLFEGNVPRPLEDNVYVYDSRSQKILAGSVPDNIRYGTVGAQYYDDRSKPIIIDDLSRANLDLIDDALINVNALRYRAYGIEETVNLEKYLKMYSGDGWYILMDFDGNIESAQIKKDKDTEAELNKYLARVNNSDTKAKKLTKNISFDDIC